MQDNIAESVSTIPESNGIDGDHASLWTPLQSTSPTFLMSSPFDSINTFAGMSKQFQTKSSYNDPENKRMWSPQDDKIFSGSTDSDTSGSYRDVQQPCVTNSHLHSTSALPSPQSQPGLPARCTDSPTNVDRKWAPQSPNSSRFFTESTNRDIPGNLYGLENLEKRTSDLSPNAIAVAHGSPLDLSFPVKDSRADCYESSGPTSVGLGIAHSQRRGSHGDHPAAAFSPMGSPLRKFAHNGILNSSSTPSKGLFDDLQHVRQRSHSQPEMMEHKIFAPAPFPPLSSAAAPLSPFRGINDTLEPTYGHDSRYAQLHEESISWVPERNEYLKGIVPSEETSPFQSLQKIQAQHHLNSASQGQDRNNRQQSTAQQLGNTDLFSMDSMQQSLRSANTMPPFGQQNLQLQTHLQHLHQQQQQLPPRSPQMQSQLSHQGPTLYFSPTRGQAVSSPVTTNAFSHTNSSDYYQHHTQGQGLTHSQSGSSFSPMAGSPYPGNSRGPSPVGSEYSYGCGSGGYSHTAHSQPSSTERHSQRSSQQLPLEPLMQFASIDQQSQQPYDGCIYQVQFKRSHRCLILSSSAPQGIKPGDFVIVEADRGEDLGVVVSMAPRDSPLAATIFAACSSSMRGPDSDFLKKILRVASMPERMDLPAKAQEEVDLLEVCRERAREMYSLPMSLVDAEYQFDRHKLILYYSASRRIDFREFVRDLFAIYKTRIWMEQATAHHSFRPSETAARALATGVLHQHHSPLTLPPSASGSSCPSPSASHLSNGSKLHGATSFVGEGQQRDRGYNTNGQSNGISQGHLLPDDGLYDAKHNMPLQYLGQAQQTQSPSLYQQHQDPHYGFLSQSNQPLTQNSSFHAQGQQSYNQQHIHREDQLLRLQRERYEMEQ